MAFPYKFPCHSCASLFKKWSMPDKNEFYAILVMKIFVVEAFAVAAARHKRLKTSPRPTISEVTKESSLQLFEQERRMCYANY